MRQYILAWLRWLGLRNVNTIIAPLTSLQEALNEHASAKLSEADQHANRMVKAQYMRANAQAEAISADALATRIKALLGK